MPWSARVVRSWGRAASTALRTPSWAETNIAYIDGSNRLVLGTAGAIAIASGSLQVAGGVGAYGAAPPASKPSFTGAKGGNTALASVIAVLVAAGFATDTTTA